MIKSWRFDRLGGELGVFFQNAADAEQIQQTYTLLVNFQESYLSILATLTLLPIFCHISYFVKQINGIYVVKNVWYLYLSLKQLVSSNGLCKVVTAIGVHLA